MHEYELRLTLNLDDGKKPKLPNLSGPWVSVSCSGNDMDEMRLQYLAGYVLLQRASTVEDLVQLVTEPGLYAAGVRAPVKDGQEIMIEMRLKEAPDERITGFIDVRLKPVWS